jgi:hypothetical protein
VGCHNSPSFGALLLGDWIVRKVLLGVEDQLDAIIATSRPRWQVAGEITKVIVVNTCGMTAES